MPINQEKLVQKPERLQYALSKNEQALAKGQEIRGKLAKFQGPLGLIAIFVSIYILLWNFIHWGF